MFGGNAAGEMLPPMVVYKAKFLYDGWISVALMVRFMIALIPGGLTDENSGSGSRKYLFQIWMVMTLLQLLAITLGHTSAKRLSSYAATKNTVYNTGIEFNSYLPSYEPVCLWAHEKKLDEPAEWMEYTSEAAFSDAFETPF